MLTTLLLLACNPDPGEIDATVGYRSPNEDGPTSGERGSVKITEILWSGSMQGGELDKTDVFVELRNEGGFPVNLSGWRLVLDGTIERTWRLPEVDWQLGTGEHAFAAAKSTGCFPEPDFVVDGLELPFGSPIEITLRDYDERLIDVAGSEEQPPFAGGWDGVRSRSMERTELMFGSDSTSPEIWHFYNTAEVDVPNDDRIAEACRGETLASPGRANSPDYSGATASGSLE